MELSRCLYLERYPKFNLKWSAIISVSRCRGDARDIHNSREEVKNNSRYRQGIYLIIIYVNIAGAVHKHTSARRYYRAGN